MKIIAIALGVILSYVLISPPTAIISSQSPLKITPIQNQVFIPYKSYVPYASLATANLKVSNPLPLETPQPVVVPEVVPAVIDTPEPVQAPVVASDDCYASLFQQYDWDWRAMWAIAHAESGCRPDAVSPVNWDGIRDYGLCQLHGQAIFDPSDNVAAAYRLWKVQGYGAWSVYNSGAYGKFL